MPEDMYGPLHSFENEQFSGHRHKKEARCDGIQRLQLIFHTIVI